MQENEKTYERDIYMEERNEELEMSADTELKKETEIQTSENSEKASADSEPETKERPVQEPKRMTIAERAKLAGNVAEKEAQEAQNSDTEEEKDKDEDQE